MGTWHEVSTSAHARRPRPPNRGGCGGSPALSPGAWRGEAALGWWALGRGRSHPPGAARCHPQAAHRKGAPGGFPCASPSPTSSELAWCNWLVPSNRKSCLRQEMMEIWSWPASSAVSRQKGTCTWVCTGTRPWSPETRDAERAVPACLGRDVGTAVGPTEDGMRLGRLGVQAHRLQGFQAVGMPWDLQKHRRNWLDSRAEGRAMCL